MKLKSLWLIRVLNDSTYHSSAFLMKRSLVYSEWTYKLIDIISRKGEFDDFFIVKYISIIMLCGINLINHKEPKIVFRRRPRRVNYTESLWWYTDNDRFQHPEINGPKRWNSVGTILIITQPETTEPTCYFHFLPFSWNDIIFFF